MCPNPSRFFHIVVITIALGSFSGFSDNLVVNGGFDRGLDAWRYTFASPAAGAASVDAGAAKIRVDRDGTLPQMIQLFQSGIALTATSSYTLEFDIMAAATPKSFRVVVEHNGYPWTRYFEAQTQIGGASNNFQHFTFTWTQSGADSDARVGLHFGASNDRDVWVDNVVLSSGGKAREPFTLRWRDDFTSLSPTRWQKNGDGTFCGNAVCFQPEQAWSDGAALVLKLQSGYVGGHFSQSEHMDVPARDFISGEVRTAERYLYGRLRVEMKCPPQSGMIQSCCFYRNDPADNFWTEFDIELQGVGGDGGELNTNAIMDNNRSATLFCNPYTYAWKSPASIDVGVSHVKDYHIYQLDWTPTSVSWYVDGVLKRTIHKSSIPPPRNAAWDKPAQVLLGLWSANDESGGYIDPAQLPFFAKVNWVEYYEYTP